MKYATLATAVVLIGIGASANADPGDVIEERLDERGDRIEQRLDHRGDRIEERRDQRGDRIAVQTDFHRQRAFCADRRAAAEVDGDGPRLVACLLDDHGVRPGLDGDRARRIQIRYSAMTSPFTL